MSEPLFLSRARLRTDRGEALASIAPILFPDDMAHRAGHAHRLVWLLFQDKPNTERDFLWRDEGEGRFLVLSPRRPQNPNGLFDLDTKPLEPHLSTGDELRFVLRANPTIARKGARDTEAQAGRARGKRVDVVMDALLKVPPGERARQRDVYVQEAGRRWLDEQGTRAGFSVRSLEVGGYAQVDISDHERRKRRARATISTAEFAGIVRIDNPSSFRVKLATGFGSAKAFGCGLMLIRRA